MGSGLALRRDDPHPVQRRPLHADGSVRAQHHRRHRRAGRRRRGQFPGSSSLHPATGSTIRRLAALDVDTLAPMHGPAFTGDCRAALLDLADDFDKRVNGAPSPSFVVRGVSRHRVAWQELRHCLVLRCLGHGHSEQELDTSPDRATHDDERGSRRCARPRMTGPTCRKKGCAARKREQRQLPEGRVHRLGIDDRRADGSRVTATLTGGAEVGVLRSRLIACGHCAGSTGVFEHGLLNVGPVDARCHQALTACEETVTAVISCDASSDLCPGGQLRASSDGSDSTGRHRAARRWRGLCSPLHGGGWDPQPCRCSKEPGGRLRGTSLRRASTATAVVRSIREPGAAIASCNRRGCANGPKLGWEAGRIRSTGRHRGGGAAPAHGRGGTLNPAAARYLTGCAG